MQWFKHASGAKRVEKILSDYESARDYDSLQLLGIVDELVAIGADAVGPLSVFLSKVTDLRDPNSRKPRPFTAAALALYRLGDERGLNALLSNLDIYQGHSIIHPVCETLSTSEPDTVARLETALYGPDPKASQAAAEILASIPGAKVLSTLQCFLIPSKDESPVQARQLSLNRARTASAVVRSLKKQAQKGTLGPEVMDLVLQLLKIYPETTFLIPLSRDLSKQFTDRRIVTCFCDVLDAKVQFHTTAAGSPSQSAAIQCPEDVLQSLDLLAPYDESESRRIAASLVRAILVRNEDFVDGVKNLIHSLGPHAIGPLEEAVANPDKVWPYVGPGGRKAWQDSDWGLPVPIEIAKQLLKDLKTPHEKRAFSIRRELSTGGVQQMLQRKDVVGLILAMGSEDIAVWVSAAKALIQLGGVAVQPLIETLRGRDKSTIAMRGTVFERKITLRQLAADVLSEIRDPRAVEPLIDTLKDKDPILAGISAKALGNIGDPKAIKPLIEALAYRKALLEASANFIYPSDQRELDAFRDVASSALANIGASAIDSLAEALEKGDSSTRKLAADALARIGDPRARQVLAEFAQDAASKG